MSVNARVLHHLSPASFRGFQVCSESIACSWVESLCEASCMTLPRLEAPVPSQDIGRSQGGSEAKSPVQTAQVAKAAELTTSPRCASLCASWNHRLTASCTTAVSGAVGTGRAASGCGFTLGVATLAADRAVPFTLTAVSKLLSGRCVRTCVWLHKLQPSKHGRLTVQCHPAQW